jgi:hypothetical protein
VRSKASQLTQPHTTKGTENPLFIMFSLNVSCQIIHTEKLNDPVNDHNPRTSFCSKRYSVALRQLVDPAKMRAGN